MTSAGNKQEHLQRMQTEIEKTWERLNTIWVNFGYDDDSFLRRQNAVVKHVTELLQEMVQEAEEKLIDEQQKLDALMKHILQLAKDLTLDRVPELEDAGGKTLLEMEQIFAEIATDLGKRKAIRMEKYDAINEKVIMISEELDEIPMKVEFEGIPADSQVAELEQYLNSLIKLKARNLEKFNQYKMSISELFNLLEKSPANDLEHVLLTSEQEINLNNPVSASGIKVLSQTVLDMLYELEMNLQDKLHANKKKGDKYWQKIRELWSRLSIDDEVVNAFTQVHRPLSTNSWKEIYKPSVLKGLQKELERLEEEKRRNMALFIKQVRDELCQLWMSKSFMTNVEVRFTEPTYAGLTQFNITDFTSELFTEELLEKHEAEVEYWRSFVERNKKIIDGINRRGQMFAQYRLLDQKSDDPSRLANRGGALLKEEKERKMLEKAIPKLENELKLLCDAFELETDEGYGMTKFLVYERTVNEMIEQDWEEFHEEKRLRKEAKKKPNETGVTSNKTLMTTQLGNPGSRKRPGTPSSASRGGLTPVKRTKTQSQVITPGKTIQSPFLHPSSVAPSSSTKRLPTQTQQSQVNRPNPAANYFRPNTSNVGRKASRKILRKSIDKLRNGSSLHSSSTLNSTSSFFDQKCSFSQPNLNFTGSSLEQLNFSEVIRGHGPPIFESMKARTPKKDTNDAANFAYPSKLRSAKKTPAKSSVLTRQGSSGKIAMLGRVAEKEQIPPFEKKQSKDPLVSPVASYSEFTDHLLCQSTLNSSAVVPLPGKDRHVLSSIPASSAPTTPTKSGKAGLSFTPAKLPLSDNCF